MLYACCDKNNSYYIPRVLYYPSMKYEHAVWSICVKYFIYVVVLILLIKKNIHERIKRLSTWFLSSLCVPTLTVV
jgi:hypothetical protein